MEILDVVFYVFASLVVLSGLSVVFQKKPVYAVLSLIGAFFSVAGLCILCGAELLSMILVVVYVGAIAVLFLFIVMMLSPTKADHGSYRDFYFVSGILLCSGFSWIVWTICNSSPVFLQNNMQSDVATMSNVVAIGMLLYTKYFFLFQMAGIILFVAMIGAIMLTLERRKIVRRQDTFVQQSRKRGDTIQLVKM